MKPLHKLTVAEERGQKYRRTGKPLIGARATTLPNNNNINNDYKNTHLNFLKGTVLGYKEHGVGIRNKG